MSGSLSLPAPRDTDAVLTDIVVQRLPVGFAWNGDPTSDLGLFYRPLADAIASFEGAAQGQLEEVDPRTAVQLLVDYEIVLGPDPAGRDQVMQTVAQRQAVAYQRWTARGGQSIAYFIALGESLGVAVSIADNPVIPWCGPQTQCGPQTECAQPTDQFFWVVSLPAGNPNSAGVAALITLYAPAHTVPVFEYV
jgi:uncharacterized protein YmfQ (DUF2313 family)